MKQLKEVIINGQIRLIDDINKKEHTEWNGLTQLSLEVNNLQKQN